MSKNRHSSFPKGIDRKWNVHINKCNFISERHTRMGCACVCAKSLKSCPTFCDPMDYSPPGSSVNGDSPGKNTGLGCHALLQGICPIQGSNTHLLCLLLSAEVLIMVFTGALINPLSWGKFLLAKEPLLQRPAHSTCWWKSTLFILIALNLVGNI